jgi:hypothetical protein
MLAARGSTSGPDSLKRERTPRPLSRYRQQGRTFLHIYLQSYREGRLDVVCNPSSVSVLRCFPCVYWKRIDSDGLQFGASEFRAAVSWSGLGSGRRCSVVCAIR